MTPHGQDDRRIQEPGDAGPGTALEEPQADACVPRYLGTGQDHPAFDIEFEPVLCRSGELKAIVVFRDIQSARVMTFDDMASELSEEDSKRVTDFVLNHASDWAYPSEFHPGECLGPVSGRMKFDWGSQPLKARLASACDRARGYLRGHIRFWNEADEDMVVCFVLSTYFKEMFEYAPRLLIRGMKDSGKSTLLDFLREVCYHGNLSSDTRESSLFRMIDECSVTPLLDEYQDYDKLAQDDIKKVLKNGNVRNRSVQRVEKTSKGAFKPQSYSIYAPVAFVHQAGGRAIPDEVISRSIAINMVSWTSIGLPMKADRDELREIRDELYTIRCMWRADPSRAGLDEIFEGVLEELQSPGGIDVGGTRMTFINRMRDIMGTMYTVARMTGREQAVAKAFSAMQKESVDEEKSSHVGKLFMALMACMKSKMAC